MFRKPVTLFVFRENQLSIRMDVKDATFASDQFCVKTTFVFDLCRQTGGFGFIVSHRAVFDRDFHVLFFELN